MCWMVRKGYCRFTCGYCGVNMTAAPCSTDAQASAQASATANEGGWQAWAAERAGRRWIAFRLPLCVPLGGGMLHAAAAQHPPGTPALMHTPAALPPFTTCCSTHSGRRPDPHRWHPGRHRRACSCTSSSRCTQYCCCWSSRHSPGGRAGSPCGPCPCSPGGGSRLCFGYSSVTDASYCSCIATIFQLHFFSCV